VATGIDQVMKERKEGKGEEQVEREKGGKRRGVRQKK
jgi:hypothetical protein